jgi:hypothetical protein
MAAGLLLMKAFGGADIHTDAAIDTGKGVTIPSSGFFVYSDAM